MGKKYTLVTDENSREGFLNILENNFSLGVPKPSQFQAASTYQQSYFEKKYKNLSFALTKAEDVLAIVLLEKYDTKLSGYYGQGARIYWVQEGRKIANATFESLMQLARDNELQEVLIRDRASDKHLALTGSYAFNFGGRPTTKLLAEIDLTLSEEAIHSDLRNSYPSLIHQGNKELNWQIINNNNPDKSLFDKFQAFHQQEAGKATRAQKSWDIQYELIQNGTAELVAAELQDHGMVSAALFEDHGNTTLYSTAVYKRDLFDKPLAHANVYTGILRAKARGQKTLYLGEVFPKDVTSDKEYNIGKFKKGFCKVLSTCIDWTIPVKGDH